MTRIIESPSPPIAIVRGGGDLATGVIYRLWRAGFHVLCCETEKPLAVRRTVSAAQAVFDGTYRIEDMESVLIASPAEFERIAKEGRVAVLIDPACHSLETVRPHLLVDGIMAKRNTGTRFGAGRLTLALGPGFTAPGDVDAVIETKRGHCLGRLIREGAAAPNTGVPGMEMGYTVERLLRSPGRGRVSPLRQIGDHVASGDVVAFVGDKPVIARIAGVLRGLIHHSVDVEEGLKIGDIDPRNERSHCFSITDKALSIAGAVLEAVLSLDVR